MAEVRRPGVGAVAASISRIGRVGPTQPELALVLGSDPLQLAPRIEVERSFEANELPCFGPEAIELGTTLLLGRLAGRAVVAWTARAEEVADVLLPVRTMRALGATILVATTRALPVEPSRAAGELALITDHINLGVGNPLLGPNDEEFGPRFPDLTTVYSEAIRALAREYAVQRGVALREMVLAALAAPNLRTRAEYRMVGALGADCIASGIVREAIVARHAGMEVLGLALLGPDRDVRSEEVADPGPDAVARGAELGSFVVELLARI